MRLSSPEVATLQVDGVDGVLSWFPQSDGGVRSALGAVMTTSCSPAEQQRTFATENVLDDAPEVRVDGAVQDDIGREIDEHQTVGDLDSRHESEIRLSVSGSRLIQKRKP